MKIRILFFYLILSNISCKQNGINPEQEKKLKLEISDLLDNWHKNAANFKHEDYISAMSDNGVYIVTDASELWTTSEFQEWSKPYFEKKHTWNFKKLKRNIYFDTQMQIAWFDELLETAMGICRGSGVIKQEENKWKIKQYVLSATIPNDLMKQVIELKHVSDSVEIQKHKLQ